MTAPERALLGLGSNLGDRLGNLQRAIDLLEAEPGIAVRRSSRVWETDPVGGPEQPLFLNVVLEVDVDCSPQELLTACHRAEEASGRIRTVRWGPRTIDIDILLLGDRVLHEPGLDVPHPRMAERAFVVLPLLDLESDPILPDGRRLVDARVTGGARPFAAPLVVPGRP